MSEVFTDDFEQISRRGRLGQTAARWAATAAMGSWLVLGVVPLVVVICALR